jgi:hypothetical protein
LPSDAPQGTGHYQVASAGTVDATGWGVSVGRQIAGPVRASVDYTDAGARWRNHGADEAALGRVAPAVLRDADRVRDLTATVDTTVAPTATRVFVVYKLNDASGDADATTVRRFDLQVNQALPFLNFSNARWEMLVAIRTLYHDDPLDGSVYNELLVVRAPKRVVGGVTVRF